MIKKCCFFSVLILVTFLATVPVLAAPSHEITFVVGQSSYSIDGQQETMDVAPLIENSRVLVPVRYLALALGVPADKISWSPSARTVTLVKDNVTVVMAAGGNTIYINDKPIKIDVTPVIKNDRTYLPARYIAEAFGYEVKWDDARQAVLISLLKQLPEVSSTDANGIDLHQVEQAVLAQINKDRLSTGLPAVEWDETAAEAARKHAIEMAQNDYMSHWDMSGKKPQQRYSEAGGIYGTTENVGYFSSGAYELNQSLVKEAALLLHAKMMAEVPPDDDHRVNILEPHHTHVGVGVAYSRLNNGFITVAFDQEFTDHYVELKGLPSVIKPGEGFIVSGKVNQTSGLNLYSVVLLWEEAPHSMSIEQLKATNHYSSPGQDSIIAYALQEWPMYYFPHVSAVGNKLNIDSEGNFTATLQAGKKEGLNYLQVWLKDQKGKIFMANELVIEVH